jgi:hypothetical protein
MKFQIRFIAIRLNYVSQNYVCHVYVGKLMFCRSIFVNSTGVDEQLAELGAPRGPLRKQARRNFVEVGRAAAELIEDRVAAPPSADLIQAPGWSALGKNSCWPPIR